MFKKIALKVYNRLGIYLNVPKPIKFCEKSRNEHFQIRRYAESVEPKTLIVLHRYPNAAALIYLLEKRGLKVQHMTMDNKYIDPSADVWIGSSNLVAIGYEFHVRHTTVLKYKERFMGNAVRLQIFARSRSPSTIRTILEI